MPTWVSDTSPICYFARLGLLDAMRDLLGSVCVPPAVVEEIDVGRERIPELPDLRTVEWVSIESELPSHPSDMQLGPGETEALALARSLPDAQLLLDDYRARERASASGMPVRGTLALLLMAKEKGLVAQVKPLMERLEAMGFRISDSVRETILALAKESR